MNKQKEITAKRFGSVWYVDDFGPYKSLEEIIAWLLGVKQDSLTKRTGHQDGDSIWLKKAIGGPVRIHLDSYKLKIQNTEGSFWNGLHFIMKYWKKYTLETLPSVIQGGEKCVHCVDQEQMQNTNITYIKDGVCIAKVVLVDLCK